MPAPYESQHKDQYIRDLPVGSSGTPPLTEHLLEDPLDKTQDITITPDQLTNLQIITRTIIEDIIKEPLPYDGLDIQRLVEPVGTMYISVAHSVLHSIDDKLRRDQAREEFRQNLWYRAFGHFRKWKLAIENPLKDYILTHDNKVTEEDLIELTQAYVLCRAASSLGNTHTNITRRHPTTREIERNKPSLDTRLKHLHELAIHQFHAYLQKPLQVTEATAHELFVFMIFVGEYKKTYEEHQLLTYIHKLAIKEMEITDMLATVNDFLQKQPDHKKALEIKSRINELNQALKPSSQDLWKALFRIEEFLLEFPHHKEAEEIRVHILQACKQSLVRQLQEILT